MKKVLLPTDFSKNALNAGRYAIEMYRHEKVKFILMHAYKVFSYHEDSILSAIPGKSTLEKAFLEAETNLDKNLKHLKSYAGAQHSFEKVAYNLLLTNAIFKELQKQKIEVIIIGSQGHTGAIEVTYGSNTISIIEEVQKCPVISIPSNVEFTPSTEVVLANSFKTELTSGDLNFLISLTTKFGASLRILHIAEEGGLTRAQQKNKKLLKEKLQNLEHSFHSLEYLSISLGIYSFIESRGSGIIAFINKKHTFLENLLMNPLYKNLAHYSKIPVLVLHQPEVLT
jgi:hypothetical protein